jgi:uncharacterized linocin/CFP29 family protein
MSEKFLHRDDAPFGDELWDLIDNTVVEAAKMQLSARRLLPVLGPYGLGVKYLPGLDEEVDIEAETNMAIGRAIPLASIYEEFLLSTRDIANFELTGLPLSLQDVARAAIAVAKQEDDLIYHGSEELGVSGLLNADGTQNIELQSWEEIGTAADDVINAVTTLDESGFHGPYSIALAPKRYNLLYRRYPRGNVTELEHIKNIAAKGVIKAPALEDGGVVLIPARQYASVAFGQDLMTGFVGPVGTMYEFFVSESLTLKILQPRSICVMV